MSSRAVGVDQEVKAWFESFREQSIDRDALGRLRRRPRPRALGGGKSGASAYLVMAEEALVLKWDRLDRVLDESVARRARAEQHDTLKELRRIGASHVAVRADPVSGEIFGIMAYPYFGPLVSDDRSRIGDLESVIRAEFLTGNNAPSVVHDFRGYFDKLLGERFTPADPAADGITEPGKRVVDLPDLARFDDFLDVARALVEADAEEDATSLDVLEDWPDRMVGLMQPPSFPDSRMVHGDPRFANIIVDPDKHDVRLIDFGAGGVGRHVFHDLARLEVDLLLRSDPTLEEPDRDAMIAARAQALLARQAEPGADEPRVRIAEIWREARDTRFSRLRNHDDRRLYALFVVNELLRRLKWHAEGNSVSEVGGTVPELLLAIRAATSSVPE